MKTKHLEAQFWVPFEAPLKISGALHWVFFWRTPPPPLVGRDVQDHPPSGNPIQANACSDWKLLSLKCPNDTVGGVGIAQLYKTSGCRWVVGRLVGVALLSYATYGRKEISCLQASSVFSVHQLTMYFWTSWRYFFWGFYWDFPMDLWICAGTLMHALQ